MSMKSIILLAIFVTSIIAADEPKKPEESKKPETRFDLLDPTGFRFSIKNTPAFTNLTVNIEVYKKLGDKHEAEFSEEHDGEMELQSDDWWTYQASNSSLSSGDKAEFVVANIIEGQELDDSEDDIFDEYIVPEDAQRIFV